MALKSRISLVPLLLKIPIPPNQGGLKNKHKIMSKNITIGNQTIRIKENELGDYLSLTDLAKLVNKDTSRVIGKWIELLRTIDFLHTWEKDYNPNYN